MPTAPDELRDLAERLWGDIDTVGPLKLLSERGYKETKGGEFIPPAPDHQPTWVEEIALDFLFMEWDFGGLVRPPIVGLITAALRLRECAGWNGCPCQGELEALLKAVGASPENAK